MIEESDGKHEASYREPAYVLLLLLALTALTVTVSRMNLGILRIWAALAIASAKAAFVLLFFMQMRRSGGLIALTFTVTLMILAIFIGFVFFDIGYR